MTANEANLSLEALIEHAGAHDAPRIEAYMLDGRRYWIKRPEKLSLRWRLQKGDPMRSFARERRQHHALVELGAPVPPILAQSDRFLIVADCGASLEDLFAAAPVQERLRIFQAAGRALAGLHALGLAHGRPLPRDLCWDGAKIRFLDFERGTRTRASQRKQVLDLVQAIHGIYALAPQENPEVAALCEGYRQADQRQLWQAAQRWARRWRWLDPLTRPLQRHEARYKQYRRYKDLMAIPFTLAWLGG